MKRIMNIQTNERQGNELTVFVKWLEFLKWFLPVLEKFPKKARFTITSRIENCALDIVEYLIEAKYSREKRQILRKVNLHLEKIRILLRISYETKLMPTKSYHHANKLINEVGMMIGGWLKQQERR